MSDKQMMVFQAGLSGRYYATKSYKDLGDGKFACTGKKYDVTDTVQPLMEEAYQQGIEDMRKAEEEE